MKSTQVDQDGNVRCPKCGGKQFTSKRTGKAKWAGVLTVGVGVAVMPKRLKCQGCGENLKTGSAKDSEWNKPETRQQRVTPEAAHADPATRTPSEPSLRQVPPAAHDEYAGVDEVKMRADEVELGDLLRWADRLGVVEDIETQRSGNRRVQLDDGKKPIGLAPFSKVKIRRLP